jgi:hypothetical protein
VPKVAAATADLPTRGPHSHEPGGGGAELPQIQITAGRAALPPVRSGRTPSCGSPRLGAATPITRRLAIRVAGLRRNPLIQAQAGHRHIGKSCRRRRAARPRALQVAARAADWEAVAGVPLGDSRRRRARRRDGVDELRSSGGGVPRAVRRGRRAASFSM